MAEACALAPPIQVLPEEARGALARGFGRTPTSSGVRGSWQCESSLRQFRPDKGEVLPVDPLTVTDGGPLATDAGAGFRNRHQAGFATVNFGDGEMIIMLRQARVSPT